MITRMQLHTGVKTSSQEIREDSRTARLITLSCAEIGTCTGRKGKREGDKRKRIEIRGEEKREKKEGKKKPTDA